MNLFDMINYYLVNEVGTCCYLSNSDKADIKNNIGLQWCFDDFWIGVCK